MIYDAPGRECLRKRTKEVNEVKGVFGKQSLRQLSVVVTVDEELKVLGQGLDSSGETSGSACQPFQVMTEVCIHCFHRIGFLFVGAHFIRSAIVERVIDRQGIGVILLGLGCPLQAGLQGCGGSLRNHIPTQHTASVSIHDG
jgi:predicted membrane protein